MGPSNGSFLSLRVIFHFHDYGRKGPKSPFKNLIIYVWKILKGWGFPEASDIVSVFFAAWFRSGHKLIQTTHLIKNNNYKKHLQQGKVPKKNK